MQLNKLEEAANDAYQEKPFVIIRKNEYKLMKVRAENVLFLKAEDKYITVAHMVDGVVKEDIFTGTLKELQSQFNEFIRIHRASLVNPSFFEAIIPEGEQLFAIVQKYKLSISRRYKSETKKKFKALAANHKKGHK